MLGFVKENEAAIKLAAKAEAYSEAPGRRQRRETRALLPARVLSMRYATRLARTAS